MNRRHKDFQSSALPTELSGHVHTSIQRVKNVFIFQSVVKYMSSFFQNFPKKLLILDVDNTIIPWNEFQVARKNKDIAYTVLQQQNKVQHMRGKRTPSIAQKYIAMPKPHRIFPIELTNVWLREFLTIAQNHCSIAVFSDLDHTELQAFFAKFAIQHIVSGLQIGVVKPKPDGLWQILSMSGCYAHEAIFIGDTANTDGQASMFAGVDFFHIETIQQSLPDTFFRENILCRSK